MKNPNIIFILIDALRARNLDCYGYNGHTSPNIDFLVHDAVIFENAYSTINATDPSLPSILSGKLPKNHGIRNHGKKITKKEIAKYKNIKTLPEILRTEGYSTLCIGWLGRWHKKGFDYYSGSLEKIKMIKKNHIKIKIIKKNHIYRKIPYFLIKLFGRTLTSIDNAICVTNRAIDIIKRFSNKNNRFFIFIHYWDTHTPYDPPLKYIKKFEIRERTRELTLEEIYADIGNPNWRKYLQYCGKGAKYAEEIIQRYDASINFVDNEIGRLVDFLKKMEILNDTIIIITSDHGESLTEHGIYFDHHGLYEESIHVPLIIRYPELPQNKKISGLVQHIDILPTILDILDIKVNDNFDGKSLLPLINGDQNKIRDYIFVEENYTQKKRAIRTEEFKYIYSPSERDAKCHYCDRIHGGVEELYDLKKDPNELTNIIDQRPEIAESLSDRLFSIIDEIPRQNQEKIRLASKIKSLKKAKKI